MFAIGAVSLGACNSPAARPIFPALDAPIQWPSPPEAARIRYLGSLSGESDLKRPRRPLSALGELFVGKKPPQALLGPRAVVVSRDGARVWVADPGGRCLHMFDLSRRAYLRVTRAGDAPLVMPVALCLGPGESMFVADSERGAIHQLSSDDGALLRSLKLPDELRRPVSLGFDVTTDELWVADVVDHDVKVLSADGILKRTIGRRGEGPGEFNFPCDLALASDAVWIADAGNHRVQAVDAAGAPLASFGQAGDASGDLALPKAVAVDADGNVYVVDGRFENVQIFNRDGELLLFFGEEGNGPGQFWLPSDVFIEPSGRVWICDSYNKRVQVFEYVREAGEVPKDP